MAPLLTLRSSSLGDITFGDIARNRVVVAFVRVAVAAAAGALQQESLAGRHLDARGGRRLEFLRRADPHNEAGTASVFAACDAFGWKAGLVEAADDGRIFQKLIFALHGKPAAPLTRTAGVRHEVETRDATGKLGLENLNRRRMQ